MSNVYVTPSIVAREGLRVLRNMLPFTSLVHRDYEAEFRAGKIGDTVTIRTPPSFVTNDFDEGTGVVVQDIKQGSAQLKLEKIFDISIEVSAKDMTLSLGDFSRNVIEPAMTQMAEDVEAYLLSKATAIYNMPTTTFPNSLGTAAWLDAYLDIMKVNNSRRWGVLGSVSKANMLGIDKIITADVRGENNAIKNAEVGRILGINYISSPKVQRQAGGTVSTTTLAIAANVAAGATTIGLDAGSVTGNLVPGSTFTIAGHYMQDGVTSQRYVVTNATAITASGNAFAGVTISPALVAAAADGDVVTLYQTAHSMNIIGDPRGFALVTVPLEMPIMGSQPAEVLSFEGISVRVVYSYDTKYKKNKVSFDMLLGAKVIDPRILARLPG